MPCGLHQGAVGAFDVAGPSVGSGEFDKNPCQPCLVGAALPTQRKLTFEVVLGIGPLLPCNGQAGKQVLTRAKLVRTVAAELGEDGSLFVG